jgi:integral membrane protein
MAAGLASTRWSPYERVTVTELRQLRLVAFLEGLSFVLLLFVAMPLKYVWELPLAVRIVGGLHGGLFLIFLVALLRAAIERDWPFRRSFTAFVASLLPFGTFFFDGTLRNEIASASSPSAQD